MKKAKDFRKLALESLKDRWGEAILLYFVAGLIQGVGSGGMGINFKYSTNMSGFEGSESFVEFISNPIVIGIFATVFVVGLVFAIAASAFVMIINLGLAGAGLNLCARKPTSLNMLFSQFSNWKVAIITGFLKNILITLWTFVFIVPGIVVSYSYAMVEYILVENPSLTASQALKQSKKMMKGNRMRLFCLELSFIGWDILALFTCGIGYAVLNPYKQVAKAAFYREISGTEIDFSTLNA